MKKIAPYGSWQSPVTAEFVAGKDRGLTSNLQADGTDLYFIEARPDEGGRQVLMRRDAGGQVSAAIPPEFNVRTRYLEYGGTCFLVREGRIFFVNLADQQIYSCRAGERPVAVTREAASRFADLTLDIRRNRLLALRELAAQPESRNTICAIDLATGEVRDLVSGQDFYHAPRLNEKGDRLLWVSWNHPNMAWNGTELWVADVSSAGEPGNARRIAGDSAHGVCLPQWVGEDEILFVAELENWFNLYRYRKGEITNLCPMEAEFAYPDWNPGQTQFASAGGTVCAAFQRNGSAGFVLVEGGRARELAAVFSSIYAVAAVHDAFFAIVGFPEKPPAIVEISREGKVTELYSSYRIPFSAEEISAPEAVVFPLEEGGVGHAWFFAPRNGGFMAPAAEKPPLIVVCHGGPTSVATGDYKKSLQFWTSRGYSVIDVNYGGSTGYGRVYRERLRGKWGLVDVSDCVAVVKYLGQQGRIDPRRVAIRGGSAGGYTTLATLAFTNGVIAVGASYYGVSELELLAKETHKLESRYLDQLVGPYPEALAVYKERSPLAHVEQLSCPVAFFQGDEDKVVPPNQSQLMHESLKKKGIYSEYHLYQGEGHGFRKAETVQHSLKAEHAFYARFFGFTVCAADRN